MELLPFLSAAIPASKNQRPNSDRKGSEWVWKALRCRGFPVEVRWQEQMATGYTVQQVMKAQLYFGKGCKVNLRRFYAWRRICPGLDMKKKETLWELISRLDQQAGEFNMSLHKANHLFDTATKETNKVLGRHQRDLHKTIIHLQKALRAFNRQKDKKTSNNTETKDAGKK